MPIPESPRQSSSTIRIFSVTPRPWPPYSFGKWTPTSPDWQAFFQISRGKEYVSSSSRAFSLENSRRANSLAFFCTSFCERVSSKSMPLIYLPQVLKEAFYE